jgi:alkylation response protein AidB-like acyl-CoA dehydrogenase
VTSRQVFGRPLAELGMAQQHIADSEIDIESARALINRCAWELDQGATTPEAARLSSMTKVFVAEAVGRVADRSVQLCGALGISEDVLLSRYLREVRAFRIYDGPSETHRWAVARRAVRQYRTGSSETVPSGAVSSETVSSGTVSSGTVSSGATA